MQTLNFMDAKLNGFTVSLVQSSTKNILTEILNVFIPNVRHLLKMLNLCSDKLQRPYCIEDTSIFIDTIVASLELIMV